MARVVRIALMWLMAFAVPLQGFAATSMLLCAPAHHATVTHGHSGHDHAKHAQAHEDDGHSPAHDQAVGNTSTKKCSVCASCCSAVTPPSEPAVYTPPHGHAVFHAVGINAIVTFLTSGPERPPRSPLV